MRLNADGTRDTTFDPKCSDNVHAIAPAADGSGNVYIGSEFGSCGTSLVTRFVRVTASGAVDTGFDVGTGFDDVVTTIVLAADGDVYVGGFFANYNNAVANHIVRLNPDGVRDTGFDAVIGFDGIVTTMALAEDGSGDIYVGGGFAFYNGTIARGIVRINADGTFDTGSITSR